MAGELEMPRLVWPHEVIGTVTEAAAAETGIPAGTPVSPGTVDAWAEAFSAGVRQPGDLMLMYGSTMFFVEVLESFRVQPKLWTTAGVEPDQYTLAAGMSTSGSLTTWIQELTGGVPFEDLVREASEIAPGSDGLIMLPYFAGERTPIFDPRARGVIAGLTLRHGRGHLFRAAYEGIAFGIRQIVEFLEDEQNPVTPVDRGRRRHQGRAVDARSSATSPGGSRRSPSRPSAPAYGDALLVRDRHRPGAAGDELGPGRPPGASRTPGGTRCYEELFDTYSDALPGDPQHMHTLARLQEVRLRRRRRRRLSPSPADRWRRPAPNPKISDNDRGGRGRAMQREADVIIVGAGLSGLIAAREVVRAGFQPLVLEADDRVGGRILTEEPAPGRAGRAGCAVDRRHPRADVRAGRRAGHQDVPAVRAGRDVLRARRLRGAAREPRSTAGTATELAALSAVLDRLDELAAEVPLDAPWTAPRAAEWDAITAGAWLDAQGLVPGGPHPAGDLHGRDPGRADGRGVVPGPAATTWRPAGWARSCSRSPRAARRPPGSSAAPARSRCGWPPGSPSTSRSTRRCS